MAGAGACVVPSVVVGLAVVVALGFRVFELGLLEGVEGVHGGRGGVVGDVVGDVVGGVVYLDPELVRVRSRARLVW